LQFGVFDLQGLGLGCRVKSVSCRVWVEGLGLTRCRVQGSGCRVWGLGFRGWDLQGLGCRGWGLGFRV